MADLSATVETRMTRARRSGLKGWLRRRGVLVLILFGLVLVAANVMVFSATPPTWMPGWAPAATLAGDAAFIVIMLAVIFGRVISLMMAPRRRAQGARLHLRLAAVFALAALVPTMIVALFAAITLDFWLENLFSERIGSVLRNSLTTAQAYEREHRAKLRSDLVNMAGDLRRLSETPGFERRLNAVVTRQALLRKMSRAYVFNLDKAIIARGEFSYLFNFVPPTPDQLAAARRKDGVVIIPDPERNEMRGLIAVDRFGEMFLYVARPVQGNVLKLLGETSQTVEFYDNLASHRGNLLAEWALWYVGVASVVVLASILLGLWFAERLAKPVGRLASAAEQVGAGDLDARVKEGRGADEIAVLGRAFNRMTEQLKGQRNALIEARDDTERRRRFIEAVLSGVTAGVIGLDRDGRIDLMNEAAAEMLDLTVRRCLNQPLARVAPGMQGLLEAARRAPGHVARGELRQVVRGEGREFLARVVPKSPDDPEEGLVLTFDDMTTLASAQRVAAWGDVARRIAHEIKNPLTPIQLSADRLRRKFSGRLGEEGAAFEQLLDVITRQTGDIRRMVDEFAKFARMPEPTLESSDLAALIRDSVLLQREANQEITYHLDLPEDPAILSIDRGLIGQVLTNLLQNAADATTSRAERDGDAAPPPLIAVRLTEGVRAWRLAISDNGVGLPAEDRDRLTDPYVTNRAKGTGLGLAIVKKIVEQHGGELQLADASGTIDDTVLDGARVTVRLPRPAGRAEPNRSGESSKMRTGDTPEEAA